jgi:hypothetical protein
LTVLTAIWNDIDLYHAYRDFTSDPEGFEPEAMRAFLRELASRNQHYVPIVDAAIPKEVNDTDVYDPYRRGVELYVIFPISHAITKLTFCAATSSLGTLTARSTLVKFGQATPSSPTGSPRTPRSTGRKRYRTGVRLVSSSLGFGWI